MSASNTRPCSIYSSASSASSLLSLSVKPKPKFRRPSLVASTSGQTLLLPTNIEQRLSSYLTKVSGLQRSCEHMTDQAGKPKPLPSLSGALVSLVSTSLGGILPAAPASIHPRNHIFSLYSLEEDIRQALHEYNFKNFYPSNQSGKYSEASIENLGKRVNTMTRVFQKDGKLPEPLWYQASQLQEVLLTQTSRVHQIILWKYDDILEKHKAEIKAVGRSPRDCMCTGVVEQHKAAATQACNAFKGQVETRIIHDNSPLFPKMYREIQNHQSISTLHAKSIIQVTHFGGRDPHDTTSQCEICQGIATTSGRTQRR